MSNNIHPTNLLKYENCSILKDEIKQTINNFIGYIFIVIET